jgi:hypothetical protein
MQSLYTSGLTDRLVEFETGNMETDQDVIDLFQELIDSGLVWQLQGMYGRTAHDLINEGYCHYRAC